MEAKILTISSKGKLSIPVDMRKQLDIKAGDKMAAYTSGDMIMLKVLRFPSSEEFKARPDETRDCGPMRQDIPNPI